MDLAVNDVMHGFKLVKTEFIEEVNSQAYLMEHEQSGARLLFLANNDDNKVFHITFRTPPFDDSGVAHILEHSTLCGSRKYRLKEPFVDLVKGSLNTFLNAMTYPDKTMYPLASTNAKDFRNLMDVYLDAVFYPLIYENPFTLRQEGWHYNLEKPEDELTYNGVVYNEMKGVYSSADAYLELNALRKLFPDNAYRFESGGYPSAIPNLTQEKFLNFHKTYYSPENSFIYLYGDMDMEETLAYLNDEYLSNFTKTGEVHSEIAEQKAPARTQEVEAYYPVDKNADTKAKTYHELSIVTGKATDVKTCMAMRLIETVLLESDSSVLRRALLEAGIGQNVSGSYSASMLQHIVAIQAAGSEPEERDRFLSLIYKTLQDITVNGLDKELLEASLNAMEFRLREADFGAYPKGLIYGIGVMENWLYGGDPFEGLRYIDYLKELREGLKTNYYESLIETYLLDNTHKVLVTLMPKPGLEEEEQAKAKEEMAALKATMSKEQLEQYIADCAELHRLQATPDSEEARASIPVLKRSDIRQKVGSAKYTLVEKGHRAELYVPAVTNGIAYLNYYFDITGVTVEQLPYVNLLKELMGKLDTEKYTYQQLATNSIKYTGGMSFDVRAMSKAEDSNDYRIYLVIKTKSLTANLDKCLDLLENICCATKFDDLKRFQELVAENKTDWDGEFFTRGQAVAITRLYSYVSSGARVNELDEFSSYQFIKQLNDNFAEAGSEAFALLKQLMSNIFQKSNFCFTYSCDEAQAEAVKAKALAWVEKLPEAEYAEAPVELAAPGHNEGITTAGKVQYVAAGGDFRKHGHKFHGAMRVLETILRYEYLWTKIRIQGGAYGATARFEMNGLGVFASYRDPQLTKTFEAYKELPAWLKSVDFSARELDKYVIGTISGMDVPNTNSMRLDKISINYLKQVSRELRQQLRDQVLNVTNEDLQALGQVVEDMLSDGHICVVGGKQPIEANKELFGAIVNP